MICKKFFFVLENVEVDQLRLMPMLPKLNPSFYIDASKSVLTHICMLLFVWGYDCLHPVGCKSIMILFNDKKSVKYRR